MIDRPNMRSFGCELSAAVIGASGGIGAALASELDQIDGVSAVYQLSRTAMDDGRTTRIDITDEESVARAATRLQQQAGTLHLVLVATGILHDPNGMVPEKSWRSLSVSSMDRAYKINAIGPALVAKHFLPLLAQDQKSAFAAISARVGSISDNELGGWHAYRASKAALNMLIRNFSIELARKNSSALCVGLHPGTVDTRLSEPFQRGVPDGKLFSPVKSARCMLTVLDTLTPQDSGHLFAWDGTRIAP